MHRLPTAYDLQSKLRDPFLRRIFTTPFIDMHNALDRYAVAIGLNILARLGISEALAREPDLARLGAAHGLAAGALAPLEWLRGKLVWDGDLAADGRGAFAWQLPRRPSNEVEEIFDRVDREHPEALPAFKIFRLLGESADAYYRDGKSGEELLFSLATLPLWFEYFSNDNLLYAANNAVGAEALWRAVPAPAAGLRILEIGGGSGSAALALLGAADGAGRLAEIASYHFTEIVPSFLRRGQRSLEAAYSRRIALRFGKLDLNLPFSPQGVPEASADVVYLVNTLHVALNLQGTLSEIRAALAPGGVLVFSECIRPLPGQPIYPEFLFDHMRSFRAVSTDPDLRPTHGFLTAGQWCRAIAAAGFERSTVFPDLDRLNEGTPYFFVGAIASFKR